MSTKLPPPTWESLNIPEDLVNYVKILTASEGKKIDILVHILVLRNEPRVVFSYICLECGEFYRPERSNEVVTRCKNCDSIKLRCSPRMRLSKDITQFFTSKKSLDLIIEEMYYNHHAYFNNRCTIDCGWNKNSYYCQFSNGTIVEDANPRNALIKSSILCPYLWDRKFNWKENIQNKSQFNFITPIIYMLFSGGQ